MNRLTAKEMAQEFVTQKDPLELARQMDWFINSFGIPEMEFLEAMKTLPKKYQKIWTDICLMWCIKLSTFYYRGYYDERDRKACEIAKEVEYNYRSQFPQKDMDSFEGKFIEKMAYTHRTLIQSFSRLVFHWFCMLADDGKKSFKALQKRMPEKFYKLPMI